MKIIFRCEKFCLKNFEIKLLPNKCHNLEEASQVGRFLDRNRLKYHWYATKAQKLAPSADK